MCGDTSLSRAVAHPLCEIGKEIGLDKETKEKVKKYLNRYKDALGQLYSDIDHMKEMSKRMYKVTTKGKDGDDARKNIEELLAMLIGANACIERLLLQQFDSKIVYVQHEVKDDKRV